MKKLTKTMLGLGMTLVGSAALAGVSCDVSNTSAWTSTNNPAGLLDVTASAAMGLTGCGLEIETAAQPGGQSTKHFVQDSTPVDETRYRAAFCIDPNSINLNTGGANRRIKFNNVQCSTDAFCANTDIVQFKLENDATDGLRIDMFVRDTNAGNAANKNRNFIPIPDAPTRIEYDLDLTAGTFRLWLNATSEADTPVLDLSGLGTALWNGVDRVRLGSQDRSGNVPAGQLFYIDEFESRRQTFIGGDCSVAP